VSFEVVVKFLGSNENCIKQLMHLQVSHLGIIEDFPDVVYRALDGADPPCASTSVGSSSGDL
jgi:hypothetical protein